MKREKPTCLRQKVGTFSLSSPPSAPMSEFCPTLSHVTLQIGLGEMIQVQGMQPSSPAMLSTYVTLVYNPGTFMLCGMACSSLTCITQITTGHLGSHFLAMCLPDPASFNCESGYITNYPCTGNSADVLEAGQVGVGGSGSSPSPAQPWLI